MLFSESHLIFHNTQTDMHKVETKSYELLHTFKRRNCINSAVKLFQSDHTVSYHRKWNKQVPSIYSPY